ncbi:MAG: hypothetical protein QF535_18630 [Anaerolineales bacterium]|jgi:hypothetical protein|nr:hypothetical protein [Anaerolineales bacterium]|tara:strand:- start:159 stop:392 length:234 start_codon:yes stop_codon:yes gene_type:complete
MRAMDRMFDRIMDVTGAVTPFRAVENVFDSIERAIPQENGATFTYYKMVPVKFKVKNLPDGSVHYDVIDDSVEQVEE